MSVDHEYLENSKTLTIKVNDKFDYNLYNRFRKAYKHLDPQQVSQVIVDLKKATHIDSAALGMLLLLDEHFQHCEIRIINCSDYVMQVMEVAHFAQKFSISR